MGSRLFFMIVTMIEKKCNAAGLYDILTSGIFRTKS